MRVLQHLYRVSTQLTCQTRLSYSDLTRKRLCQQLTFKAARASLFHTTTDRQFGGGRNKDQDKKEKQLVVHQGRYFDEAAKKSRDKRTFLQAIDRFSRHVGKSKRGQVEFIYAALPRMKEFGVERDLETYKKILDLFPKEKMVAKSTWQVEMMHYPKQQQCCIDVLQHMEDHGVIPDDDMGYQLVKIFGSKVNAFRKYQRMMYWMPKFKYANPYYLPYTLPDEWVELAKMALKRMAVDLEQEVTIFDADVVEDAVDHSFIVSGQSPKQRELVASLPTDKPVFVEGGFRVWLRSKHLTYFMLRSDVTEGYHAHKKREETATDNDLNFDWKIFEEETRIETLPPSLHEQEDGTILGMCITETGSKDSLVSWIKCLEETNPKLTEVPIMFLLRSPEGELLVQEERKDKEISKTTPIG